LRNEQSTFFGPRFGPKLAQIRLRATFFPIVTPYDWSFGPRLLGNTNPTTSESTTFFLYGLPHSSALTHSAYTRQATNNNGYDKAGGFIKNRRQTGKNINPTAHGL